MADNYIFYSLQCIHSRQLLQKLKGFPICKSINFINIDDPKINIPQFIQVVPTLYISSMKKILSDTELQNWTNNIIGNSSNQNINMQQNNTNVNIRDITGDDNISPFVGSEMLGGSSAASYSFIDDKANEQLGHNFGFLDDRDASKIPTITKFESSNLSSTSGRSGKASGMDKEYEQMMAQRSSDIPKSQQRI